MLGSNIPSNLCSAVSMSALFTSRRFTLCGLTSFTYRSYGKTEDSRSRDGDGVVVVRSGDGVEHRW